MAESVVGGEVAGPVDATPSLPAPGGAAAPRPTRRTLVRRSLLAVAVLAAVFGLALPRIADYGAAWAAVGTIGMAFTVLPKSPGSAGWTAADGGGATPCFRCLFENAPPPGTTASCETAGVVGSATGIVANFQVTQALKVLTGNFAQVSRTLLNIDLWSNEVLQLDVTVNRDCSCCGQRRFDFLDGKAGSSSTTLCGRNAVQLRRRQQAGDVDLDAVAARLATATDVAVNEFMLRARISEGDQSFEVTLFPDGRAIIKGTGDIAVARSIYAKYIGH